MNALRFDSPADQARAAAQHIATCAERAIRERGRFSFAMSGGKSPRPMYEELIRAPIDWSRLVLFQVDERVLPLGDPGRNRTLLEETFVNKLIPAPIVHWMPVELPLAEVGAAYETTVQETLGPDLAFDLVHLGLGADGHTASLIPGDVSALAEDVHLTALSHEYQGTRRLTLTYPLLRKARELLWFVGGADKARALEQLMARDLSIPAGRLADLPATAYVHLG